MALPIEITHRGNDLIDRIIISEDGKPLYVQVEHKGNIFRVDFATTEEELAQAKVLDDEVFAGQVGISMEELQHIIEHGYVLLLRDNHDELIAESQLLVSPTPEHTVLDYDEVYCYGTAVRSRGEKNGYAYVMFKAQEAVARQFKFRIEKTPAANGNNGEENLLQYKTRMTLTVRPENARSIRARLNCGYRIYGYDPNRYGPVEEGGARLIMEKSLVFPVKPFDPEEQIQRVTAGLIPIAGMELLESMLHSKMNEIAVPVMNGEEIDLPAHAMVRLITQAGYIGIGLLRPEEYGEEPNGKSLLIFHKL
jgi:hypothetical protein